jgi:CheY-like chemotaxis protein
VSPKRHLLIVDDDALTREVLTLVAEEAGFAVSACDSGEAALAHLALGTRFSALLVDMQMPGLSGDALAERLRDACLPGTRLVAISGSHVPALKRQRYDNFLLKPFQFHEFVAAMGGAPVLSGVTRDGATPPALDLETYASLACSMPAASLQALYTICIEDAQKRVRLMADAHTAGDSESFRRAAHAIRGSCGMVGAGELAAWAAAIEDEGSLPIDDFDPFPFFDRACARLRTMLDSQRQTPVPGDAPAGT